MTRYAFSIVNRYLTPYLQASPNVHKADALNIIDCTRRDEIWMLVLWLSTLVTSVDD